MWLFILWWLYFMFHANKKTNKKPVNVWTDVRIHRSWRFICLQGKSEKIWLWLKPQLTRKSFDLWPPSFHPDFSLQHWPELSPSSRPWPCPRMRGRAIWRTPRWLICSAKMTRRSCSPTSGRSATGASERCTLWVESEVRRLLTVSVTNSLSGFNVQREQLLSPGVSFKQRGEAS